MRLWFTQEAGHARAECVPVNMRKVQAHNLAQSWEGLGSRIQLTASSCRMCSVVASRARVPLVASSSTAFTVLSKDVTLVTITCGRQRNGGHFKDQGSMH